MREEHSYLTQTVRGAGKRRGSFSSVAASAPSTPWDARLPPNRSVAQTGGARWALSSVFAVAFVAALVLPSVSLVGHGLVAAWLLYLAWILTALYERPHLVSRAVAVARSRRLELWCLIGWMCLVIANFLLGRGYAGWPHTQMVITLAMLATLDLACAALGENYRKPIASSFFLLLGIEAMRSIPILWTSTGVVRRVMYFGGASDVYRSGFLGGVGEYGFYTGCAIISPVLFAVAIRSIGWRKITLLAAWWAVVLAITLATLMGAVILAVTGFLSMIALALVSSKNRQLGVRVLAIVTPVALAMWFGLLATSEQGEMLSDKWGRQSSSALEKGVFEGDLTNRAELWRQSIDTVVERPFFGIGPVSGVESPLLGNKVGGHSSLFDVPAEYGLIGLFLYSGFVLAASWRALAAMKRRAEALVGEARVACCVVFLLGGLYNPIAFVTPTIALWYLFAAGGPEAIAHLSRPAMPS